MEQGKWIDDVIKIQGRQQLGVARKLAHMTPIPAGFGAETVSYDVLTEVSAAKITTVWGDFDEDIAGVTRTSRPIPIIAKAFKINARQLAASRLTGTPLDSSTVTSAIYRVGQAEDDLLMQGHTLDGGTSYVISGFYQGAGNTEATADDFGTEANVYAKLALGIAKLEEDSIYRPYNLALASTQYNEIMAPRGTDSDSVIADMVKKIIGGDIFMSADVTTDTGMLMATPDRRYFDIAVGQDMTHKSAIVEPLGNLEGFVYECLTPRIFDSTAICKLTNI